MVTEQLKGRGNTTTWFLFVARLDTGAHFVCTLLNTSHLTSETNNAAHDAINHSAQPTSRDRLIPDERFFAWMVYRFIVSLEKPFFLSCPGA